MSKELDLDDVAATSDLATTELMRLRGERDDAQARIRELEAERDKLIKAVADHVTVRAEQYRRTFGNRGSALTAAIDTVVAPHPQKLAELESKIEFQNNELAEKQKYILSLERNLWGAELRNAQILSVAEKMRCAGGAQEFQYWFDELKWFLLRKQDTSALDTAIDAAIAAQEKS